ncbi:MAG: ATP-binding protein [Myxococcota bacterium]
MSTQTQGVPDDAPEVCVRAMRMLLVYFERRYGRARLEALFEREKLSLSLDYLRVTSNYVSLRFIERLQDLFVAESGDPDFVRRAAMLTATPDALGFAYYLMKAFGSPRLCYEKSVEMAPTYNRVGAFTIEHIERSRMVLAYKSRLPERSRRFCEGRMAQFASFPTIWGLPPATVSESQCQWSGADRCLYHLEWHNPTAAWRRWVGLLAGATAGGALGVLALAPAWPAILALAAAGFVAGAWLDAGRELRRKDELLSSQNEGMMASMRDLQRRYEELQRARDELRAWSETLEARVAERGRQLEEARAIALHNEKLAALGTLLSGVGHELNNPLGQILRNAGNLGRDLKPVVESLASVQRILQSGADAQRWLDDAARLRLERRLPLMEQAIHNIERGTARSIQLVRSLNAFSRSSSDPPRRVPLRALIDEAVTLLQADLSDHPVRFDVSVPADFEACVFEAPMLQVILNLAQNAVQAMRVPSQHAAHAMDFDGTIAISARAEKDVVILAVADTGSGIPEEILPKIFTPFFTTRPPGQGTGLGLAIVQSIVCEKHCGEIHARNRAGEPGAIFEVRIPKNLDAIHARAVADAAAQGGTRAQPEHLQ